jgi:hypothetical protein
MDPERLDAYHMEKYVIPGAAIVLLIFLTPGFFIWGI